MKISELSRRSGASVPTLKFYIREGLLPPGERTGRNQATYDATHLCRVALIRSLRESAGLPIERIAAALRAADAAHQEFIDVAIERAIDALGPASSGGEAPAPASHKRAQRVILELIRTRKWQLDARDESVRSAVRALSLIDPVFPGSLTIENLAPYVDATEHIARTEVRDDWKPEDDREEALRFAILGTVMIEPLILSLRRMVHVSRSRRLRENGPKRTKRGRSTPH